MELIRKHGDEDARLISKLIVLIADLRRAGNDTEAEICAEAMSRLDELTQWIDIDCEAPPEDTVVLAVVNGKLGSITFINSIEPAQYFGDDGWLLESFINVDPSAGDHIDIKLWQHMPAPPMSVVLKESEVIEI